MATALVLIGLSVIVQAVVLTKTRSVLPRFAKHCPTCQNQLPPMECAPVIYDCPECMRLINSGVNLSDPLPRL